MQEISQIHINQKEAALLALIEAGAFGQCNWLMDEQSVQDVLANNTFGGSYLPMPHAFSPCIQLNGKLDGQFCRELELVCEGKHIGYIKNATSFANDKNYRSIFNTNLCHICELNPCISGQIEIKNNQYKKIKRDLARKIDAMNAQKITAVVLSADPITRAHERMLRWTIDKADLVLVFIVEGSGTNSLDFALKQQTFEEYAKEFLPLERIFPIFLRHVDLFSPYSDPNYECLMARSFGADKFVIGQNHPGIGLFYSEQHAHTAVDLLSKNSGLELIVLPEFAFCTKCKVMISSKSCPHGAHHHIKYRSSMIRAMLHAGLIPPTVLVRKEISAKLLAHLHPQRFADTQMLYNGLFPSEGIIEKRSDEDLYKALIKLYQTHSMI